MVHRSGVRRSGGGALDRLCALEAGSGMDEGDEVGCVHGTLSGWADPAGLKTVARAAVREPAPWVTLVGSAVRLSQGELQVPDVREPDLLDLRSGLTGGVGESGLVRWACVFWSPDRP